MNTSATRQSQSDMQLLENSKVNRKCFSQRILLAHPSPYIESHYMILGGFDFPEAPSTPEIQSVIVPGDGCTDLVKGVSRDFFACGLLVHNEYLDL